MASSIKFCALALDFDGVIANLEVDWNQVIKKVSEIANQDVKSLLAFYESSFGKPIYWKVSSEVENIELDALKKSQTVPLIETFLKSASEKQIPIYIVSMQTCKVIMTFLNHHRLTAYINEIVTREKFPTKKAQVEYVIKKVQGKVLFVDDLKRNLNSCEGLDVECVYFPRKQNRVDSEKSWQSVLKRI
jgi:beta-phosphoglucomutase-like phosphatase (HAD superfamily)